MYQWAAIKPNICDADNLSCVKNKDIACGDYKESEAFIDDKTFAYLIHLIDHCLLHLVLHHSPEWV